MQNTTHSRIVTKQEHLDKQMNAYCVQQGQNPETTLWEKGKQLYVQVMRPKKYVGKPFFIRQKTSQSYTFELSNHQKVRGKTVMLEKS